MPANNNPAETPAHRNARIVGAWWRTNHLLVGEVATLRDQRALIEGGVMTRGCGRGRPAIWTEATVNLRSLKEMSNFLRAA